MENPITFPESILKNSEEFFEASTPYAIFAGTKYDLFLKGINDRLDKDVLQKNVTYFKDMDEKVLNPIKNLERDILGVTDIKDEEGMVRLSIFTDVILKSFENFSKMIKEMTSHWQGENPVGKNIVDEIVTEIKTRIKRHEDFRFVALLEFQKRCNNTPTE